MAQHYNKPQPGPKTDGSQKPPKSGKGHVPVGRGKNKGGVTPAGDSTGVTKRKGKK